MPLKNKEEHRVYCRKYAAEHQEEAKKRAKAHYHANKDAINARRRSDPVYVRRNKSRALKFRTGATLEEKEKLLASQFYMCAACGDDLSNTGPRNQCLDHDHKTGALRAVLCNCCNIALGMVKDDTSRLEKLIVYLERF